QLIICAEIRLRIHHNLMAACDQEMIRRVYSKPQALSQCRNWLSKNVPQATLHSVASTAVAAEPAARGAGAAAGAQAPAGGSLQFAHPLCRHRGLALQRDALRGDRPPALR